MKPTPKCPNCGWRKIKTLSISETDNVRKSMGLDKEGLCNSRKNDPINP